MIYSKQRAVETNKMRILLKRFFIVFLFMPLSFQLQAANCKDVFPAAITANATLSQQLIYNFPENPPYKNFWSILDTTVGSGNQYYSGRGTVGDIHVTHGSTTRLYVKGNLSLNRVLFWSADVNEGGRPEDLLIIVKGDLYISKKTSINALIFVEGNVTIEGDPEINGAITATGNASLPGGNQTFDAHAVSAFEFSTLCSIPPVFDRFEISAPASASTCSSAAVSISARSSSGELVTDFVNTLTLNTSSGHGDWALNGGESTLVGANGDDGNAQYTFVESDGGVLNLSLNNTHADSLTVSLSDDLVFSVATSSSIVFSDNALNVVADNPDIIAGRDHLFSIEYLKMDPVTGSCGVETSFSGTVSLKMSYLEGASHPAAALAPSVNGMLLLNSEPSASNVSLDFISGVSDFTLTTSDIGQYSLSVKDESSGLAKDLSGNPLIVVGSSPLFSVRPFGFYLDVPGNSDATDASGGVFSQAKAGGSFEVSASAVLYNALDDMNADGIPDGHDDLDAGNNADLSDNLPAPAFGQEGETLTLSALLIQPTGGHDPGLEGSAAISTFLNGTGTSGKQVIFNEVGIIEISAAITDGNYLSASGAVYGKSAYVGRFVPDHFEISANQPLLSNGWFDANGDGANDWSCGFSYQGQSFALDINPVISVVAVNDSGEVTQNYTGAFNKLSSGDLKFVLSDNAAPSSSQPVLNTLPLLSVTDRGAGFVEVSVVDLTDTQHGITYIKGVKAQSGDEVFNADFSIRFFQVLDNTSPTLLVVSEPGADPSAPIEFASVLLDAFDTAGFNNTDTNADGVGDLHQDLIFRDSDGVCYLVDSNNDAVLDQCDDYVLTGITGTEIRYGRLKILNAYGSELLPLSLVYKAEYYDFVSGSSGNAVFKVNEQDNNSASGCIGTVITSADTLLSAFQVNLAAGDITDTTLIVMNDGLGRIVLSAPGAGNDGLVSVSLSVPAWLQYDFDGDGSAEGASATASFGVAGGREPLFFQRESYR